VLLQLQEVKELRFLAAPLLRNQHKPLAHLANQHQLLEQLRLKLRPRLEHHHQTNLHHQLLVLRLLRLIFLELRQQQLHPLGQANLLPRDLHLRLELQIKINLPQQLRPFRSAGHRLNQPPQAAAVRLVSVEHRVQQLLSQ